MFRCLSCALVGLLLAAAPCRAADWKVATQQSFNHRDLPGWVLTGAAVADGKLITAGGEAMAKLDRTFDAPAIRVIYDATMVAPSPDGKISDLSCFVGDVFFKFGGSYNNSTQINRSQNQTPDFKQRITLGKTYKVIAEINGLVARLSIDGKIVGEHIYTTTPENKIVTLYTWAGTAHFDNLTIETAAKADPVPEHLQTVMAFGSQTKQTLKHLRDWPRQKLSPEKKSPHAQRDIPLVVDFGPAAKPGMTWPITRGVPLPRGALFNPDNAMIIGDDGREIPSQRNVTATWSEGGSIRWLLLDFMLPVTDTQPKLTLRYGNDVHPAPITDGVRITETARAITLDGGAAQFTVSKTQGSVITGASLHGKTILGESHAYYDTAQGWHYTTNNSDELDVKVEMAGPLRTVVRSRGWYTDPAGRRACYFTRRLYVYKGLPWARLITTWTITVDTRAYTFTDVGVTFNLAHPAPLDQPITHLAADRGEGYIITGDNRQPAMNTPQDITSGGGGVAIGCFEMNRQWPAALSTDGRAMTFHGFTNRAGLNLDMTDAGLRKLWGETYNKFNAARGTYPPIPERNPNGLGFAKTHELIIDLSADRDTLDTFQQPPMVAADPVLTCATGVVGPGEYHPYDAENFPGVEASIEKQRDELLSVLERIKPWYGFWDYGAGVPHHIIGDVNGDGPLTYNGYRRCYDVGYQQPLVPWQMHLRSAQRAWLTFARRTARCLMDARTQHWTDPTLGKHVGYIAQDHSTWAWDTNLVGFGFNSYTPALLFDYYTTGYERAMDVHTEILDAYCTDSRSSYYYTGATGNWLGNCAEAYRATWEAPYKEKFEAIQQCLLDAVCQLCGGVKSNHTKKDETHDNHGKIHRNGWVEYGIVHALQVDDHNPALRDILVRNGADRYATKGHTSYAVMAYARLLAYQATGDERTAREARDLFDLYMRDGIGRLTFFSGMSYLRGMPVLMELATVPGLDEVVVPSRLRIAPPLVISHERGKATQVMIETPQNITREETGIVVRDRNGQMVPGVFDPILGRFTLAADADAPSMVYYLEINRPRLFKGDLDALAWVTCDPDTKLAVAIPQGYHHFQPEPLPKLWFHVPAGTKQFRVRNNIAFRTITVTRPDGVTQAAAGEWMTVDVPGGLSDEPWSVESDHKEHANFQCVKLYGIPALVSLSRDAVFAMDDPPMPMPDGETMTETFASGVFGESLRINSNDQMLIPLGEKIDTHSRQRLTASRGTIEFFFRLNSNPYFAKAAGLPMQIRADDSVNFKNWARKWLSLNHKNGLVLLMPDGRQSSPIRFGPWDPFVGMIELSPRQWYHLAIVWDANKTMDVHGSPKAVTQLRTFLDGRNLSTGVYDQPHWLFDKHDAPLPAAVFEWISAGHDVSIDELRVSDVERVGYSSPSEVVSFPVPARAYDVDEHTLILMHFDGDVSGVGRSGDRFEAAWTDRP